MQYYHFVLFLLYCLSSIMDRRGRDRMLIEVTSWDYQCLSPQKFMARCTRYNTIWQISQWCWLFSPVSSTSETDDHDITEILLKVVHNLNYNNVFHLITASDYYLVSSISVFKYFHVMSVIEYQKYTNSSYQTPFNVVTHDNLSFYRPTLQKQI